MAWFNALHTVFYLLSKISGSKKGFLTWQLWYTKRCTVISASKSEMRYVKITSFEVENGVARHVFCEKYRVFHFNQTCVSVNKCEKFEHSSFALGEMESLLRIYWQTHFRNWSVTLEADSVNIYWLSWFYNISQNAMQVSSQCYLKWRYIAQEY